MGIGVNILADAGNLPGNFPARLATRNLEVVVRDFFGDVEVGTGSADGRQLIAEVLIERLKPLGQFDDGFAFPIQCGVAVIDVHHVGRLDEGVVKVLVGGVQGIINLERTGVLGERAAHRQVASNGDRAAGGDVHLVRVRLPEIHPAAARAVQNRIRAFTQQRVMRAIRKAARSDPEAYEPAAAAGGASQQEGVGINLGVEEGAHLDDTVKKGRISLLSGGRSRPAPRLKPDAPDAARNIGAARSPHPETTRLRRVS